MSAFARNARLVCAKHIRAERVCHSFEAGRDIKAWDLVVHVRHRARHGVRCVKCGGGRMTRTQCGHAELPNERPSKCSIATAQPQFCTVSARASENALIFVKVVRTQD